MATYSYLVAHLAFLSQTQGSALEGEKPMSNMMSWILWDHLRPELFSPYNALYITSICPSSSSNSGPATMYDRIPSTTPGAEPPRGTKDSGSARSHSTHLETSSQKRP